LEYQRYGSLSNVDLALLYQTKSCVFLEGPSDARFLPRIAEKCGVHVFSGPRQLVPFEFQGVDKLKFLPDLVRLFQRITGGTLRWGVVRDSDSNVPKAKEAYKKVGESLGAGYFHQWERHSLENYLLDAQLLLSAVKARAPKTAVSVEKIDGLLAAAVAEVEDLVSGPFVTRAQHAFRDLKLAENPHDAGATAATKFLRQTQELTDKLKVYPGKLIFGKMVELMQNQLGINLRIEDVIAVLTPDNAPQELVQCLRDLASRIGSSDSDGAAQQGVAADGAPPRS
jgi:hypothetical protein